MTTGIASSPLPVHRGGGAIYTRPRAQDTIPKTPLTTPPHSRPEQGAPLSTDSCRGPPPNHSSAVPPGGEERDIDAAWGVPQSLLRHVAMGFVRQLALSTHLGLLLASSKGPSPCRSHLRRSVCPFLLGLRRHKTRGRHLGSSRQALSLALASNSLQFLV